jgi:hypothetical protein
MPTSVSPPLASEPRTSLLADGAIVPAHPAPVLPSVLDICPQLRGPARRSVVALRRLVDGLVVAFPDAAFLAREPRAAEWLDTTPHDHLVADLISSAGALSDALAALGEPL